MEDLLGGGANKDLKLMFHLGCGWTDIKGATTRRRLNNGKMILMNFDEIIL